MKKTPEEIRAEANEAFPYCELKNYTGEQRDISNTNFKRIGFIDGYAKALTDMQQPVDLEALGISDLRIEQFSWNWAEAGNGSGDRYFADCNFKQGAEWMRDKLLPYLQPTPKSDAVEFADWVRYSSGYTFSGIYGKISKWVHIYKSAATTAELYQEFLNQNQR